MQPVIVPDIEIWIVAKWVLLLFLIQGVLELAKFLVRRSLYGKAKYNRREDDNATRGWLDRFLELQQDHTSEIVRLREETAGVRAELERNGDAIRGLVETWKCNYQGWQKRKKENDHD